MVSVTLDVKVPGALNRPLAEIVPTVEFPPLMFWTSQVTRVSARPLTLAVYCCVVPALTTALLGDTATLAFD